MKKTISPKTTFTLQERLRQLEFKRSNATSPTDWTESDREEFLVLQRLQNQPTGISEAHQAALNRQFLAGIGNNPPLTEGERKLIQEANYISMTQNNNH